MNKYSKGKNVGIITAALATVALLGVGFSTWVVSVRNTETDVGVGVVADDVKYKSMTISAAFTGNLKIAEKTDASASGDGISFTNSDAGNLKIKVKFTFKFGRDFEKTDFTYTKINFAIEEATGEYVDNKVLESNVFTRSKGKTGLTYFEAPTSAPISINDDKFNVPTDGTQLYYTVDVEQDIEFGWGSLFGNVAPSSYYTTELGKLSGDAKFTYGENIVKEMKAMNTTYTDGKQIKLKMSLAA